MKLSQMIQDQAPMEELAAHLDSLSALERRAQTLAVEAKLQKLLYERAQSSAPLSLDFFVPPHVPDNTEVIHYGRNAMPAFQYFQKRWARPANKEGQLIGYNEASMRPLIGPGYFVAHPTDAEGTDVRGAVVVDYFMTPDPTTPPGWPRVRPNSRGLQMFVYNKTRDYMRRISQHVSIGIAYRQEKTVMGYFVLCRDDKTQ